MNIIAYKLHVYAPYGSDDYLGEVRCIESTQWLEDYQAAGEVKIICGATSVNLSILADGNRIINTDLPGTVAIVCDIDISDDMNSAKMTVRCRTSLAQWTERVVMYTQSIANAEAAALRIAYDNRRGLPCNIGTAKGFDEALDTQKSWGDVYTAICEICQNSGLGVRVAAANDLTETLELYKGKNRTNPSSADYVGYFGDDIKNILNAQIKTSSANYKNVAIVAGQGEGAARTVVKVDLSNGAPIKELFVDAKDIEISHQETQGDKTVDILYTKAEYEALLSSRGLEKLAEHGLIFEVQPTVTEAVIKPCRDYNLGDILPLQLKKYGIQIAVQVQQLKFVYEQKCTVEAVLKVVKL